MQDSTWAVNIANATHYRQLVELIAVKGWPCSGALTEPDSYDYSLPHVIFNGEEKKLWRTRYDGATMISLAQLPAEMSKIMPLLPAEVTRLILDATAYPSEERTIVALATDGYQGAHNYEIKPMLRYENGAVYGLEGMPITFVKRNEDGSWQPGLQSEQLLHLLADRHEKLNVALPAAGTTHGKFMAGINMAIDALRERVDERAGRGVMGTPLK